MLCWPVPHPGILTQLDPSIGSCPAGPALSMQSTCLTGPRPRFFCAGLCRPGQPSLIYTPRQAFQYFWREIYWDDECSMEIKFASLVFPPDI